MMDGQVAAIRAGLDAAGHGLPVAVGAAVTVIVAAGSGLRSSVTMARSPGLAEVGFSTRTTTAVAKGRPAGHPKTTGNCGQCHNQEEWSAVHVDHRRAIGRAVLLFRAFACRIDGIMLEKEAKNIDAVTVGTPDHIHAVASMAAAGMPSASIAAPSITKVPNTRLVKKPRESLTTMGILPSACT